MKKVEKNQTNTPEYETLTKDANTETNTIEYVQVAQQRTYGNRNTLANM